MMSKVAGLSLRFESPVALFSTPLAYLYFVSEFYQQLAIGHFRYIKIQLDSEA